MSDWTAYPIYERVRARAPGLTLEALDGLLKDAWAAGFHAGVEDLRPEVEAGNERLRQLHAHIDRVIQGNLNHVSRRLADDQRRRTTIKTERAFMERQAAELRRAIAELTNPGSPA